MDNSLYCINLDSSLRVESSGVCRSCCLQKVIYHDENETSFNVKNHTFEEILDNKIRKQIIEDLKNGIKHPACNVCWDEEDAGKRSKREIDNRRFRKIDNQYYREKNFGPSQLDISLSNVCNLKCRTCNIHSSSFWKEETWDLELYDKTKIQGRAQYNDFLSRYTRSFESDSLFWNEFVKNIPNVSSIQFYGGEPFLVKKQWEIIQKIVEMGYDKFISIEYNINGTLLDLSKLQLLKNFKRVNIDFSLDGIHDRLHYLRYPAKHDSIIQNLKTLYNLKDNFKNLTIGVCHTISILNVYYIEEIFNEYNRFVDNIYLNLVHNPEYYCIANIPDNIKFKIISHIQSIPDEIVPQHKSIEVINFMKSHKFNENNWRECWRKTKLHDNYRVQDYVTIFPEYTELCTQDVIFNEIMGK